MALVSARPPRSSTTQMRWKVKMPNIHLMRRGFSSLDIRSIVSCTSSSSSGVATQFGSSRHDCRRRRKGSYMKNKQDEKSELTPEDVELVVTQEDYEAGLKRGWTDDDMLKPGRYKLKRGGFLARHPELKIKDKRTA